MKSITTLMNIASEQSAFEAVRATVFNQYTFDNCPYGIIASDTDINLVISICENNEISPLFNEIYVTLNDSGNLMPQLTIDGWYKVIANHPDFDGFTLEDSDEFVKLDTSDYDGQCSEIVEKKNIKVPAYISCTIHRKSLSHATAIKARFDEYFDGSSKTWLTHPSTRLEHKAIMKAGRAVLNINIGNLAIKQTNDITVIEPKNTRDDMSESIEVDNISEIQTEQDVTLTQTIKSNIDDTTVNNPDKTVDDSSSVMQVMNLSELETKTQEINNNKKLASDSPRVNIQEVVADNSVIQNPVIVEQSSARCNLEIDDQSMVVENLIEIGSKNDALVMPPELSAYVEEVYIQSKSKNKLQGGLQHCLKQPNAEIYKALIEEKFAI